jgi:hypothetical protein
MKEFILPADPFWLLRVPVKQGECVPISPFPLVALAVLRAHAGDRMSGPDNG